MQVEIYTDGSATVTGKPGGYGFVVVIDGVKYNHGNGYMESATNNDAELQAAIEGLKYVHELLSSHDLDSKRIMSPNPKLSVTLVSDSQLILGWASKQWQFKQLDKIHKYEELMYYMNALNADTRWVEGHKGDKYNEMCDKLANQARLSKTEHLEKIQKTISGETLIGNKKTGVVTLWYKDKLKVIDLDKNIIEDYNREIHGPRGSALEIREEKSR